MVLKMFYILGVFLFFREHFITVFKVTSMLVIKRLNFV